MQKFFLKIWAVCTAVRNGTIVAQVHSEVCEVPLHGSETVMVVDDDDSMRKLVAATLKRYGYSILSARGGKRGIDCFRKRRDQIDLILTDILMPGMNGPGMVDTILEEKPSMKVLFMTGYSASVVLPTHLHKRFAVIEKPFTPESLARAVRECLESCR